MIIFIVDMIQIHRCLPFVSCFPSVYACFVNFDKSWLFVCVCECAYVSSQPMGFCLTELGYKTLQYWPRSLCLAVHGKLTDSDSVGTEDQVTGEHTMHAVQ